MSVVLADLQRIQREASGAIEALMSGVELPGGKQWGDDLQSALVSELLISTLSHAMNEDLMVALVRKRLDTDSTLFTQPALATWTGQEITYVLDITARLRQKDDPERLAELVRSNFEHLVLGDRATAQSLIGDADCGQAGIEWLRSWLANFPAFKDDPLQKKSSLFLQRLFLQDYFGSKRVGQFIPFAVDRHIVRLMLRLGWVVVDPGSALAGKVRGRKTMNFDEDLMLRSSVLEALEHISVISEVPPPVLNFAMWQFSRSYCARYQPGCISEQRILGRGSEFTPSSGRCLFGDVCTTLHRDSQLDIYDPVHRGGFY